MRPPAILALTLSLASTARRRISVSAAWTT
jgi:hypothetical protein